MSKLVDSLINQIIAYTPNEKAKIGTTIVEVLGGDASTRVTNLPTRRGKADGGIDGRIKIIAKTIEKKRVKQGLLYEIGLAGEQEAGVSVKLQSELFSREQLGGFKLDLERENIYVGIIITARGLAPDVEYVIKEINKDEIYRFYHISIKDILLGKIEISGIEFMCGDISKRLRDELAKSIETQNAD